MKQETERYRLSIDGEDYCEILEIQIAAPFQGRSQQRLILDRPVTLDLADPRKFELWFAADYILGFDAYESGEDGLSLLGCPGPRVG